MSRSMKLEPDAQQRVLRRAGGRCQSCGRKAFLEIDHVHSKRNGGQDDEQNAQALCAPCNTYKSDRNWDFRSGWRSWPLCTWYRRFFWKHGKRRKGSGMKAFVFLLKTVCTLALLLAMVVLVPPLRSIVAASVVGLWNEAKPFVYGAVFLVTAFLFGTWYSNRQMEAADEHGQLRVPRRVLLKHPERALATIAKHQQNIELRAKHQVPHHYAPKFAAPIEAPPFETVPRSIEVPSFSQLLSTGKIGPKQPLILAYTDDGALEGSWNDLYTSFVFGLPGSGKSTTVRYLLAVSALCGVRFVIVDPHGNATGDAGKDTLARTVQPLASAFLTEIAIERDDMIESVKLVKRILDERKGGAPAIEPVLLVIDEFSTAMRDPELARLLVTLLESIASEGRKFLVNACLMGQQAHASRTGGGELKSIISSFYIHRSQPNQARILTGLPADMFPDSFTMKPGEAYLVRTSGEVVRVRVPNTVPTDLDHVGRMLDGDAPRVLFSAASSLTAVTSVAPDVQENGVQRVVAPIIDVETRGDVGDISQDAYVLPIDELLQRVSHISGISEQVKREAILLAKVGTARSTIAKELKLGTGRGFKPVKEMLDTAGLYPRK